MTSDYDIDHPWFDECDYEYQQDLIDERLNANTDRD